MLTDGLDAVEAACAEALSHNVHSAGVILNILARHREPPPTQDHRDAGCAKLGREPAANCDRYDSLRETKEWNDHRCWSHGPAEALRHEDSLRPRSSPRRSSDSTNPQQIIGDLLAAEISEKQGALDQIPDDHRQACRWPRRSRSFDFEAAEVNETLIHDLATGGLPRSSAQSRARFGGTGTGKTHLAVSIARACIRKGRRGPVLQRRRPGEQARRRSPGRTTGPDRGPDLPASTSLILGTNLAISPVSPRPGGQLLLHLISKLYEGGLSIIASTTNLAFGAELGGPSPVFGDAKMTHRAASIRLTHHLTARSSKPANESWRFKRTPSIRRKRNPRWPAAAASSYGTTQRRRAHASAPDGFKL